MLLFLCFDHPVERLQNCSHKITSVWLYDVLTPDIYPKASHEALFTNNTSCEKVIQFSVSSDFGAAPDSTALINYSKLLLKMTTGEKGKDPVSPQELDALFLTSVYHLLLISPVSNSPLIPSLPYKRLPEVVCLSLLDPSRSQPTNIHEWCVHVCAYFCVCGCV